MTTIAMARYAQAIRLTLNDKSRYPSVCQEGVCAVGVDPFAKCVNPNGEACKKRLSEQASGALMYDGGAQEVFRRR